MRWTDPVDSRPRRHARVWLDPARGAAALVEPVAGAERDALLAWIARGHPLVARRRAPDDGEDCCLAIALPLIAARRRIGCTVRPDAIVRVAAPLRLDEVIATVRDDATSAWRSALLDLQRASDALDVAFHVYGSLAWQAMTGERYVVDTSDVDLLWSAGSTAAVDAVLRVLVEWDARWSIRADGELLLANGDGIPWRELLGAPDRILVKHRDHVSLQASPAYWQNRLAEPVASSV